MLHHKVVQHKSQTSISVLTELCLKDYVSKTVSESLHLKDCVLKTMSQGLRRYAWDPGCAS